MNITHFFRIALCDKELSTMLTSESRRHFSDSTREEMNPVSSEETLVSDARSGLRTEEILESKLGLALSHTPHRRAPVSGRIKPR